MKGLEDLERAFERGLDAWEGGIVRKHAERMGQKAVREIKRRTPIITGNLRRRWRSRVEAGAKDVRIILEDDADYAAPVNNGHRIVDGAGRTVGYKQGKHMLEKGLAAYQEHYMPDDLQAILDELSGKMKG